MNNEKYFKDLAESQLELITYIIDLINENKLVFTDKNDLELLDKYFKKVNTIMLDKFCTSFSSTNH